MAFFATLNSIGSYYGYVLASVGEYLYLANDDYTTYFPQYSIVANGNADLSNPADEIPLPTDVPYLYGYGLLAHKKQ